MQMGRTDRGTNIINYTAISWLINSILFEIVILGISEDVRKRRKQKNLVATKLNFIAWSLEVDNFFL